MEGLREGQNYFSRRRTEKQFVDKNPGQPEIEVNETFRNASLTLGLFFEMSIALRAPSKTYIKYEIYDNQLILSHSL